MVPAGTSAIPTLRLWRQSDLPGPAIAVLRKSWQDSSLPDSKRFACELRPQAQQKDRLHTPKARQHETWAF